MVHDITASHLNENSNVIAVHGAREHNLKELSLTIPRGKFVVVTGVSGSGKSTLAFDIIFAEGQRRFQPMRASLWSRWRGRMWI